MNFVKMYYLDEDHHLCRFDKSNITNNADVVLHTASAPSEGDILISLQVKEWNKSIRVLEE